MKAEEIEQFRDELATRPCEVCGAPSTSFVYDFLDIDSPQTMYFPEYRHDGNGAHFFCDAHYRDSRFTRVSEGWPT